MEHDIYIYSLEVLGVPLLSIYYDGLHDVYRLFNKFTICKIEHDRDFWNEWDQGDVGVNEIFP